MTIQTRCIAAATKQKNIDANIELWGRGGDLSSLEEPHSMNSMNKPKCRLITSINRSPPEVQGSKLHFQNQKYVFGKDVAVQQTRNKLCESVGTLQRYDSPSFILKLCLPRQRVHMHVSVCVNNERNVTQRRSCLCVLETQPP